MKKYIYALLTVFVIFLLSWAHGFDFNGGEYNADN